MPFLAPCGAKSGGGGGAPPTNLILLRNQRPDAAVKASPARSCFGGPSRPQPDPTRPHPIPSWWWWWWLVVVGWSCYKREWEQSAALRREVLNSDCASSICVLTSFVCPRKR